MCVMWSSARRGRIIRDSMNSKYPSGFIQLSIEFACKMLQSDGEFFPYAEATSPNGIVTMIGIDFSSRVGTEIRVELEQLYAGLKEQADNDLIIESAIVTNRTRDSQDAKVDCIVVDAETRMGFSAYILFDYQLN